MSTNSDVEKFWSWRKQLTISRALAGKVADGVFLVVAYNRVHFTGWPKTPRMNALDPYEVYPDIPREVVGAWIVRAQKLLSSNYAVGDAVVGRDPSYGTLKAQFIAANPGFSEDSYDYAIHLGASAAR